MYIFSTDPSDDQKALLSRSSKAPANLAESALNSVVVALRVQGTPPINSLSSSLLQITAPTGTMLSAVTDSFALANPIHSIGQIPVAANDQSVSGPIDSSPSLASQSGLTGVSFEQNLLSQLGGSQNASVAISNLADSHLSALPLSALETTPIQPSSNVLVAAPIANPISPSINVSSAASHSVIDVTTLGALGNNAPVTITALSDNAVTVINHSDSNVQIADLIAPLANVENFINTGNGSLTVITKASQVSSLSLSDHVTLTATADEVTTGITVSGEADSSNVVLFIVGGASSSQGVSDVISLGNGNNTVFDAGDGQVIMNFGSGQNAALLSGSGVSGSVHFAAHTDANYDLVALAPNGASSVNALAHNPSLNISGLNNTASSLDAIAFLGDLNGQLLWVGGSGANAQVTTPQGDASNLASWITAAQSSANFAHSVAWFHFEGNTYIFESANGMSASIAGDTLVKLTGVTQFTGGAGELSLGMLHLAG